MSGPLHRFPMMRGQVTLSEDSAGVVTHAHWKCLDLGRICTIPTIAARPDGWRFDGNKTAPSLTPSIRCHGCGWHGYIRAGVLETVKD